MINDIMDFFGFLLAMLLPVALIGVAAFGLTYANERWNCNTYEGAPTKMIAGTCYVQSRNGRWVTHSSYIKEHNVQLEQQP